MSQRTLRVAIGAHLLASGGGNYRSAGIHTYIERSLRHLPEVDADLQLTVFTRHAPAQLSRQVAVRGTRWPTERPVVRIAWEQLALPLAARTCDVLHAAAFVSPWLSPRPTVLTIYDLSFALFPQYFRGFNQAYLRAGTRMSARRAARVIAISDNTRRDIHRLYGVPLDRITVAYPGVDEALCPAAAADIARFKQARHLPDKFFLYLGTLEPRKNLITLVQAFARLKHTCPDATLVLAGGMGWLVADVLAAIEASGVQDSIMLPGFVPADEKVLWLSSATAFVYPSNYEGFGLPPLEAMACGTPIIVSTAASLPEVAGDAGVQIDPADVRGWTQALQRVWEDAAFRAELIDRGVRQARKFNWRETARQIAAAYRQL